jgi:nicotinamide-nucleotide amidase
VQDLLAELAARRLTLAVAEGDTGGMLLEQLTAVPGSSAVVLGGVVAYHDDLKRQLLGVSDEMLKQHGAVSREAAEAMARGIRSATGAEVGVAATGIAGPGGATALKPVGLSFVAAVTNDRVLVREFRWAGDRRANRQSSVDAALTLLRDIIRDTSRTSVLHSSAVPQRGTNG